MTTKPFWRKPGNVLTGMAALGAVTAAATVIAQSVASVPSGPNRLQYPADWAKGVLYATVDRPDTRQYRELYTSEAAVRAAREGRPIPDGTIITLAAYSVQMQDESRCSTPTAASSRTNWWR